MQYSTRALLVVLIVSCSACSRGVEPEPDVEAPIVGVWKWVSTTQIWPRSAVLTPATEGYVRTIRFTEQGVMEEWMDGQHIQSSSYRIEEQRIDSSGLVAVLVIDDRHQPAITLKKSRLLISYAATDGPVEEYIGIRPD